VELAIRLRSRTRPPRPAETATRYVGQDCILRRRFFNRRWAVTNPPEPRDPLPICLTISRQIPGFGKSMWHWPGLAAPPGRLHSHVVHARPRRAQGVDSGVEIRRGGSAWAVPSMPARGSAPASALHGASRQGEDRKMSARWVSPLRMAACLQHPFPASVRPSNTDRMPPARRPLPRPVRWRGHG